MIQQVEIKKKWWMVRKAEIWAMVVVQQFNEEGQTICKRANDIIKGKYNFIEPNC